MFSYTKLMQAMSGAAAATADAFFNLVTLLLNTTATNGAQNNTFLDSSTNNFSITRNGNTTQGTFTPFSQTGWGTHFTGTSGTRLTYPGSASTYVSGTGDFTIEMWINIDAASAGRSRVLIEGDVSNGIQFRLGPSNTTNINGLSVSRVFNADNEYCSFTFAFNTWYHVAVCRASAVYYFFVNGVQYTTQGSGTSTYDFQVPSLVSIGDNASYPNDEIYKGYISNIRVSNVARYTSNFTPSTTPLTALSGTQFLSLQNNRWIDNSTNNSTITSVGSSGTPSVQAFSPFLPTTAYDAAVVGGSAFFDGTGDNLTWSGTAAGSGAFSYEFWLYSIVDFSSNRAPLGVISTSGYNNALDVRMSGTTINMSAYNVANNNFTVPTLVPNTWYHVVLCRNASNQATVFLNGVRSSTGAVTITQNFSGLTSVIGAQDTVSSPGERTTGYLSSIRLIVGSTPYDPTATTITVPTAPLTAITNTQLLTNYTNAGIFDSAAKNVLETVGNAQVSTTQAKWGTTSMYFDGTGDLLLTPNGRNYINGTEPFTIECWVYVTGTPSYWSICGAASGTLVLTIQNLTTININPYGAGNTLSATTSLSINTWTHIAATRDSANRFDIWVNGVSAGNATSSQSFGSPTYYAIGAADSGGTQSFTGYIDDLRISKFCRYTTTFTPPTAAFPLQ